MSFYRIPSDTDPREKPERRELLSRWRQLWISKMRRKILQSTPESAPITFCQVFLSNYCQQLLHLYECR